MQYPNSNYGFLIAGADLEEYIRELNAECGSGERFSIGDFAEYGFGIIRQQGEFYHRFLPITDKGGFKDQVVDFDKGIVVPIKCPNLFFGVYKDIDDIAGEVLEVLEKNNLLTPLITPAYIKEHIGVMIPDMKHTLDEITGHIGVILDEHNEDEESHHAAFRFLEEYLADVGKCL